MVKQVDESNFIPEVLEQPGLVLVEFYGDSCAPCRAMGPVLDALSNDVKVVKVNTSEATEVTDYYRIDFLPSIILFKDGEVAEMVTGVQSKKKLLDLIEQNR